MQKKNKTIEVFVKKNLRQLKVMGSWIIIKEGTNINGVLTVPIELYSPVLHVQIEYSCLQLLSLGFEKFL
jgi:hypothetical protein